MTPIIVLLVITTVSLLIIRVGALALSMTGLSHDTAGFQALSAFFGVGFTTRESELVVNHPVRRKIIRDLIIAGNVGLTSVLATVVATVVRSDYTRDEMLVRVGVLACGLIGLWLITRLPLFQRAIDWTIRVALKRGGVVRAMDYDVLLRVADGYSVAEVEVLADSPMAGRTLGELRLRNHGVVVLGVMRNQGGTSSYFGVPKGDTSIERGDVLSVYGRDEAVRRVATGGIHSSPIRV